MTDRTVTLTLHEIWMIVSALRRERVSIVQWSEWDDEIKDLISKVSGFSAAELQFDDLNLPSLSEWVDDLNLPSLSEWNRD